MKKLPICVVDDDERVRTAICDILERAEYSPSPAGNGKEGLECIGRIGAVLAVIDLIMPDQEGLQTIALAKERFPTVKILAISGGGREGPEGYLSLALAMGADAALAKPFGPEQLLGAVADLLRGD